MIKTVGVIDVTEFETLDLAIFGSNDPGMLNDEVALDASIAVAWKYFGVSSRFATDFEKKLINTIDLVKEKFFGKPILDDFSCSSDRDNGSILVFRNVESHKDEDFFLYKRGSNFKLRNRIRATTFSIVLRGTCSLNLHRKNHTESLLLAPGDVYCFDQNILHSVAEAYNSCVHLTISVPANLAKKIPAKRLGVVRKLKAERDCFFDSNHDL